MATFDPYAATPDYAGQGSQLVAAWQRANAKLNLQKNTAMAKYGFRENEGDLGGNVTYNPDGTLKNVTENGGMTGVGGFADFAGKDNLSGQGSFRDELGSEAAMLDDATNGPDRGFSGGLANQAADLARRAVTSRQSQFTAGYNDFATGFNQAGTQNAGDTNTGAFNILDAQLTQGENEAAWQSTIPVDTYTPGVSGGGSTPITSSSNPMTIPGADIGGAKAAAAKRSSASTIPGAFGGLGHIT